MRTALIFKALSDPLRLRMIHLLTYQDELCVCHFMEVLGLPQSTVSRHLAQLKHLGLVESRRDSKWVYYRLSNSDRLAAKDLFPLISDLTDLEPQFVLDTQKLSQTHCS